MRNKTLSVLALLLSLSIYFSCIDEGVEISGLQIEHLESDLLSYAKQMVGENGEGCSLIDLRKGSANSRVVTDYSTVATPLWEKARTERYGDEEVLIVPLQGEDEIYSSLYFVNEEMGRLYQTKSFSRLIVRTKNGRTITQVFTYLPGRNYAKNRQAVLDTMGFSPWTVKYYGTILASDIEGKFQQGFYYERGVPTIHLTPKRHTHTEGSCSINDSKECKHHEHSHSEFVYLKLTGSMRVVSRSFDEGEEIQDEENEDEGNQDEDKEANYCALCGSTEIFDHTCLVCSAPSVCCEDCGKPIAQCVCHPSLVRCGRCNMYYCECFDPCDKCFFYPCICDELIGGGNNSGGDNLGGGGSGGGSNSGNNSEENSNGNPNEEITKENFRRLVHNKRLEENVRMHIGIEPDSNYILFDNELIMNPSTNAMINGGKILISNNILNKSYSIGDLESIVFHEYVHLTQPVANMSDVITKEIPYADFEIEDAKKDFYTDLLKKNIPIVDSVELTDEQKIIKKQLWNLYMSDYLDEDEKPKSRLVSYNYQFCINEKQAYILQVQVYDHEMTEGEFKSKMIYQANYFTYICEQLMK